MRHRAPISGDDNRVRATLIVPTPQRPAMHCFAIMAAPGPAPQGGSTRKTRIRVSPPAPAARKRDAPARLVTQSDIARPVQRRAPSATPASKATPAAPSRSAAQSKKAAGDKSAAQAKNATVRSKTAAAPKAATKSAAAPKSVTTTATQTSAAAKTRGKRRTASERQTRRVRASNDVDSTSRERSASEPPRTKKKWAATRKRTRPSQAAVEKTAASDGESEVGAGGARRNRGRRRRSRTTGQNVNRSFATYMDEVSSYALLEQREVTMLARDIRAGVEVEDAQRALTATLRRRASLPELGERLGRSPEEVRDAVLRGTAAKNRLVAANLRLVSSVARRIAGTRGHKAGVDRVGTGSSGLALEDMIQEGSVGLIRAAEKYDASRGYQFSTYATWWIRASVMRAITTQSRSIRVPSTVVDEYARIRKEYERQRQSGIFAPSDVDVASELGITPAKLRFVVSVVTRTPASLDLAVGSPDEPSKSTLGELVEGDDRVEERMVETMQRRELDRALQLVLKPIERAAVRLRFGLDDGHPRTLREIGSMLGLSKERVRQLSFRALAKLNTPEMRKTLTEYLE